MHKTTRNLLRALTEFDEESLDALYNLRRRRDATGCSLDVAVFAWRDAGCPDMDAATTNSTPVPTGLLNLLGLPPEAGVAQAMGAAICEIRAAKAQISASAEQYAELDRIGVMLDEAGAPRVQDTHTLTPADRLAALLDARAEQTRAAAEDDAEEWIRMAQREAGLVEAVAALGRLLRGGR